MAINKVIYGQNTIIDITDTTAVATDVASGKYFYLANGQKVSGTASGGVSSGDVWQDEYGLVHLSDEPGTNVLVTPLSITSNGTYTATSGTAYSPVTVNVPQSQPTARTARISTSGNSSFCYVEYNNTKYYTIGDSFTFYEGDTIVLYVMGETWASINICGNEVYSTSSYGSKYYNYTAPADNLTISLSYSPSPSSGYAEIIVSLTDYPRSVLTGVMPSRYTTTVHPSSGYYGLRYVQISGDTNLVSGNIKSGVSIFGVNGTYGGGGVGLEVDDVAMRTISGTISGNATKIEGYTFSNCSSLTQAVFPSCTSIGTYAFYSCTSLTQISFPVCTSIASYAFYSCSSLTQADFPSCTSIGTYAFYGCRLLSQISFPVCTSIGLNTFSGCTSLTQADFPSCTSIGAYAFYGCSSLTQISFPVCTLISASAFQGCRLLTQAVFPSCTSMGMYAFSNCTSLTQADFPACTFISAYAFYNCILLSQISFPVCTTIGGNAFSSCTSLTQAVFPSCTSIGAYAFYSCTSLTQADFPSCTSIGGSAFHRCISLSQISFPVCTSIVGTAFSNCTSLTQANFPACTFISANAFYNCISLSQISFPVCTSIGASAFYSCNWLTTAIFSTKSVTNTIYTQCFVHCSRLISLYLLGSSLYTLSSTTASTFVYTPILGETTYTDGVLGSVFVPMSLYNAYISNAKWSDMAIRFVSLTDAEVNNVLMYGRHDP